MAKRENQKKKLIRLLEILVRETDAEHGLSMNEIISRLEEYGIAAERKSIYDDFMTLEELGFSVGHIPSRPPKYTLETKIFELAELKMLVDAVESSKFITARKSREIIEKLSHFASSYEARQLSRQVYVEDRVKTQNSAAIYTVDAIHTAINEGKKLSFKYFDYDADKEKKFRRNGAVYKTTPCSLLWDDEKYYLVAYDEDEKIIKNFRVDKMEGATVLDEARESNKAVDNFNPADYSKKIFGMYGGREELVTLECREKLAGVVIDRFGSDPVLIKTDFGFKFSIRVMVSPTFFSWVLGFFDDMRIISPENVKNAMAENLRKIAKYYEI